MNLILTSLFSVFLFCFTSASLKAQEIDLNTIPMDSTGLRQDAYNNNIYYNIDYKNNPERAMEFIKKGKKEFEYSPYYTALFFRYTGAYYEAVSEKDSCFFYLSKALVYAKNTSNETFQAKIYIDYGYYYNLRNNLDSAIYYYVLAEEVNKNADNKLTGTIHNNIGLIKLRQKDYLVAKDYFLESIKDYEESYNPNEYMSYIMSSYTNLANCYQKLEQYNKALTCNNIVLKNSIQRQDTLLYIESLTSRGLILLKLENYRASVDISLLAYNLNDSNNKSVDYPLLYNLSEGYLGMEKYDSSIYYNKIGLNLALADEIPRKIAAFRNTLEIVYTEMGDFKNAYKQLVARIEVMENDLTIEQFKSIEEIERKYRNEQKTHEIILLTQQTRVQYLSIILLLTFLTIAIITVYLIFKRRKLKFHLALAKQKDKIAKSVLIGQETERKRISIELHDAVGASLANISMRLNTIVENKENLISKLTDLQVDVDNTCVEVRTIAHNLAPYKIEHEGLKITIEDLIGNLNGIQKTQFKASIDIQEEEINNLSKSIIYRIVQELTRNICKHANATVANVNIEQIAKKLIVQVNDNGQGYDDNYKNNGIGLDNVKTRVAYLNGDLEIVTEQNYGALFSMTFPL